MSDQSTETISQASTGAAEQPTSPASGAASSPLPDYVVALQGQVEQLSGLVKGIQKGTDKQIGQVRGDIKRILELKEKGLDETQIQRELFIDQMIGSQTAPVQTPVAQAQPDTGFDVEKVIAPLQFAANDPALAALRIKYHGNPQGLAAAAADLRLQQLQSPNPSPATAPSQQGGAPSGGVTPTAEMISRLEELQKFPTKNKAEIASLYTQLEARGWK